LIIWNRSSDSADTSPKVSLCVLLFFETLIVKFNADELQEMLRLMKNVSNNINQITVRVNSTNAVYREDLKRIEDGMERIWQQLKYFQSQLQCIKH
jgi:hypothetical protein